MEKIELSMKKDKRWTNKLVDKFVNSKYREYGNNPIGWYLSGNFLPGEKQEYLLSSMNKWTLKHSVTGIVGNALINGIKIWGGIELLSNAQTASSGLTERVQEVGAGGLFLWSVIGLAEIGIRTYYICKTKKPIANLGIEAGYYSGMGFNYGIKKIISLAGKTKTPEDISLK